MKPLLLLVVDEETRAVFSAWRIANPATREGLLIFGATGLVALLAVIWAIFLRKRRRRRHAHHHSHQHSPEPTQSPEVPSEDSAAAPSQDHRQRRRRRRRHRARNPTLAETGGLPPIRPDSPPEPRP